MSDLGVCSLPRRGDVFSEAYLRRGPLLMYDRRRMRLFIVVLLMCAAGPCQAYSIPGQDRRPLRSLQRSTTLALEAVALGQVRALVPESALPVAV